MSTFYERESPAYGGGKRFNHFVLGSKPKMTKYSEHDEVPYGDVSGGYHPDTYQYNHPDYDEDEHTTDTEGTRTLFGHKPAGIDIDFMNFDPSLRIHAPVMAARLHQKYNAPIVPSDNLSKFSSQLVNHARKLGLPLTNVQPTLFNSMRLDEVTMSNEDLQDFKDDSTMHEVHPSVMHGAKKHLRNLYQETKQKEEPDSVEKTPLPGMEDF